MTGHLFDVINVEEQLDIRLTGAIYTPFEVAKSLTQAAVDLSTKKVLNILEPSVGDGFFLSSLLAVSHNGHSLTAIDINKLVIGELAKNFEGLFSNTSSFINQDFIQYRNKNSDNRFNLIVGNPPFIRKHNYSIEFKQNLVQLSEQVEYELKDLKNAWAAFVVASESLLSEDGILAFIVPYEVMTVSYGQKIQKEIFTKFERVDIYVPDEKAFKDIDQDAVAFIAQKKSSEEKGLFIHRVRCLSDLRRISTQKVDIGCSRNLSLDLKAFLFDEMTTELLHGLRQQCLKVNDYCESAPGLVTGANNFFIRKEYDIRALGLLPWAKPVLKKGAYIPKSPVFTEKDFHELSKVRPTQFLYFKGSEANNFSKEVLDYLKHGEDIGLTQRYKCRHRKHWYEVPLVSKSEGFFFKRSYYLPRLCINEADVLITDTAYRIRLHEQTSMRGLCYSFYNSLTLLFAEIDGRFYGGGVLELTPSEFKGLPIVYVEPSRKEFEAFLDIHKAEGDIAEKLVEFGDQWLMKKLSLTNADMLRIRSAWSKARNHRLRHGSKKISK